MRNLLTTFWTDDCGLIISAELVLIGTVGVLALMTGLVGVRDSINGELHELSEAFGSVNQSYYYSGQHGCLKDGNMVSSYTAGSSYIDLRDECDQRCDVCSQPAVEREKDCEHKYEHKNDHKHEHPQLRQDKEHYRDGKDHHTEGKEHHRDGKPARSSISAPQQNLSEPDSAPEVPAAPTEEPMELRL